MERITDFIKKGLFYLGMAMGVMGAARAMSDVIMAPRRAPSEVTTGAKPLADEETFPESRFGAPPAKPFVARAVDELESNDEELPGSGNSVHSAGRAPAGLSFGNSAGAGSTNVGTVKYPVGPRTARAVPMDVDSVVEATTTAIQRKGVQEVALIAGDLGFFPKTVFVSRDVPVRLYVTGASKNTLCIMMDSFQVRKQVHAQKIEEIIFTPNVPGSYRFYCPVNGSEGVMIVKELAS